MAECLRCGNRIHDATDVYFDRAETLRCRNCRAALKKSNFIFGEGRYIKPRKTRESGK